MNGPSLPFGEVLSPAELLDPATRERHRWLRLVEIYVAECASMRRQPADDDVSARCTPRASELAHLLDKSPEHLSRMYRRATGVSIAEALKQEQSRLAAQLLERTPLTTVKIGRAAGFGTTKAFYRTFASVYGITPGAYRRQIKKR